MSIVTARLARCSFCKGAAKVLCVPPRRVLLVPVQGRSPAAAMWHASQKGGDESVDVRLGGVGL